MSNNLQQGIKHLHMHVKAEFIFINGSTLTNFNEKGAQLRGREEKPGENKKSVYIVSLDLSWIITPLCYDE